MGDILPNGQERTGIVEKEQARRELYERHAYKPPVILTPAERQAIGRVVDERVKAEVAAIVAASVEAREREIRSVSPSKPRQSLKEIVEAVTEATGVALADLQGPRRARALSWPRHFAIWLIRELRPDLSLPAIGRVFNRDHTTIMHGVRATQRRREQPPFDEWFAHPRIVQLLTPPTEGTTDAEPQ